MITTRHDLHAKMVIESIKAGKHVFVEKPLAIYPEELETIIQTYQDQLLSGNGKSLTVGFNRRFSPFVEKAKQLVGQGSTPMNIIATMNAGYIPPDVWVQHRETGGGRIIGEACHYIDLMIALTGSKVTAVMMSAMGTQPDETTDNAIITLQFESGAQGVINYFSNGNKAYAKERVEIYAQGKTLILDNFRKLQGFGFKGFNALSTAQDKGHTNQFGKLIQMVKDGGAPLIPFEEIINTTRASFAALESLTSGRWIKI
jgi:predicted dehydrogenase